MRKLFTLLLVAIVSISTLWAYDVQIGELYYNLDAENKTAEVTYKSYDQYKYNEEWNIKDANIPESVEYESASYVVTSIGKSAFYNSTFLASVNIPNSIKSIGDNAFYGCSSLVSVEIPISVTSIGYGVFGGCTNLTSLIASNKNLNVEDIGEIFLLSPALKHISMPASCFEYRSELKVYTEYFPQNLESLEVISGELSENAMWLINLSRKTLKSIDLSGTTHTELFDEAFNDFYNLETLRLPENLTHIGYKMVAECVKLKAIDVPASVVEIDDRAFEDCRSIESITFGGVQPAAVSGRKSALASTSQLQRIGNWAFYNAHKLQHLQIPEGVTEIGDGAFYGCTYLEDLSLPASVRSIGDNCFALCGKISKILVNSPVPPTIAAKTFYDVNRQIPVYVPDDNVDSYKNDELWGQFDIQGVSKMPSAVSNITTDTSRSAKIIRDGQLFIHRNGKLYSTDGAEVE